MAVPRKRTYTIAEASELTGISRKAVARRIERGSIRSVVRNGRRLIPRSELVRAGLVPEDGDERGAERGSVDLPSPAEGPDGDSETALVTLVRDLMARVERQANELAQFRALTVHAESLRADRDLAELRTRLAVLESTAPERERVARPKHAAEPAVSAGRSSVGPELWLPPGTPSPSPRPAGPDRRPVPGRSTPEATRSFRFRGAVFALEVAFIVLVGVAAALAGLSALVVVAAIAAAWLLVAAFEFLSWTRSRS